jgi:hypothetical protein
MIHKLPIKHLINQKWLFPEFEIDATHKTIIFWVLRIVGHTLQMAYSLRSQCKCRRGFDENMVCKNIQKGEELLDFFPQGNKEPINWRTILVEVAIIFEKGMWATLIIANPLTIGWVSCFIHTIRGIFEIVILWTKFYHKLTSKRHQVFKGWYLDTCKFGLVQLLNNKYSFT